MKITKVPLFGHFSTKLRLRVFDLPSVNDVDRTMDRGLWTRKRNQEKFQCHGTVSPSIFLSGVPHNCRKLRFGVRRDFFHTDLNTFRRRTSVHVLWFFDSFIRTVIKIEITYRKVRRNSRVPIPRVYYIPLVFTCYLITQIRRLGGFRTSKGLGTDYSGLLFLELMNEVVSSRRKVRGRITKRRELVDQCR